MIIRAVLLFLASTSVAIGETAILRAPDPEGAVLLEHVPPQLNQGDSRGAEDGRGYRH
jgi:hypothetical protein